MKLIEEVDNMPLVKDQEFIRLRTDPLAQSIKQHAKQWMDCYGKMLLESSTAGLKDLHDMLLVSDSVTYLSFYVDYVKSVHRRWHLQALLSR